MSFLINSYRFNSGILNTKSLAFDGVDDYMDCGNGSDLQITSNISVSCWFKTSSSATMMLITKRLLGIGAGYGYQLYMAGGVLRFLVTLSGSVTYTATGTTIINDGQWHHVLGTINQNTQISIILDGSTDGTNSIGPEAFVESNNPLLLGYNQVGAASYYFDGLMDEVSIFDALVSSSALRKNGEPANLSSVSNLVAWYRMGDYSTYQTPQILMPENTNIEKVSNYSMAFDGVDDQIQFTKTGIDTAISVSCWVKTTHVNVGTKTIVCEDDGSGVDRNWNISITGLQKLQFVIWHTDLTQTQCNDPLASRVQDGAWHHILGTWDGTTNADSMKLYVDGGLVDSNTPLTTGVTLDSTLGLSIGALQNNINWNFNGSIDEVAVWDSGIDISSIWDGSGTPTDLSSLNPLRYIKLGEGSKFTSQWLVPNQMSENTAFDFGDRTQSEYITLPQLPLYNAITVSAWIKTQKNGVSFQTIISNNQNNGTPVNEKGWVLDIGAGWASGYTKGRFVFYDSTGSTATTIEQTSAQSLVDDQWHHVVALWDGTTNANAVKIFVDGVLAGEETSSFAGPINQPVAIFEPRIGIGGIGFGGSGGGNVFGGDAGEDGYISNVQTWDTALTYGAASSIGDVAGGNIAQLYNNGFPLGTAIASDDIQSWWKLDKSATFENTNWIIPDATITPTYTEGLFWGGVYIGGSPVAAYAHMSLANPTVSASNLTYSCWYKLILPTTGNSDRIFGSTGWLGNVDISPSDIIKWNGDTATEYINFGNAGIADGAWHHILIYYPNTSSIVSTDVQCFVDGKEIAQTLATPSNPFTATTGPVTNLNGSFSNGTTPLNTVLSNWAYWGSDQRSNINTIYNEGTPGDIGSLSPDVWLKYDAETTALTGSSGLNYGVATDSSGNNNHGNIAGGTDSVGNIATELRTTNVQAENGVSSAMTEANLVRTPISFSNVYSKFSFDFDGVDDWINCGSDSIFDLDDEITLSVWMKTGATDTTTTVGPMLYKDSTGGGQRSYGLQYRPLSVGYDKGVVSIFHTNGNATSLYTSTAGALSDGNWHHVMATYDGTDGTDALKIYVDGVLDNTATPTSGDTGIFVYAATNFTIGSISHGASWFFGGSLDEVALFSTDQSANISTIYNSGQPSDLTSLSPVAWYRMGEDSYYNAAVGVSGNTTADAFALQLNDGGATFLSDNISIGDLVRNTTDDTITHIAAIVNDTQINIDDDIFPVGTSSGDGYKITGPVVWTVPDQIGSNDGTSANMAIQDLQGEAPNYTGAGVSSNMYIEDRVGDAPNSENNAVSYNMYPDDIDPDVP